MTNMGWECPRCHKINAPTVQQCTCVPSGYYPYYPYPWPYYPYWGKLYPWGNYTVSTSNTTNGLLTIVDVTEP